MLRVLTLSTLFPDASRPNFGVFVERQTIGLATHPDVALTMVAPIGLPPWPLSRHPRYRGLAGVPIREMWKHLEVHRPRFLAMPGTGGRWHSRALARALAPVLDTLAFDVIDASFFFPDGPAAVALGKRYGIPVSIKARGADIHHWGDAPATARQVREAGRAADGLLAVSETMKSDMVAMGMPGERIRVHHTGVDLDRFAPSPRGGGTRVISVGALIPRKAHEIVIEAVALLPGVSLDIAGDGPERARLQATIDRLDVGDRVQLLGSVPHGNLPALIAAADVMALASSSEGLANAWVEALACGTPIVIPDAGGAREVVTTPADGRIVARDAGAFAGAIRDLLTAPPSQVDTRRGAEGFTWAANTAALYDHLNGLVSVRR